MRSQEFDMREFLCPGCRQIKKHRAKNLCINCYDKLPRKKITCLGCGEIREHRARRLCALCYDKKKKGFPKMPHSLGCVREEQENQYDSMRVQPLSPTMARPGTEEKIQVLIARHARHELLWHPHDCLIPSERGELGMSARPGRHLRGEKNVKRASGWHNSPVEKIFSVPDEIGLDAD